MLEQQHHVREQQDRGAHRHVGGHPVQDLAGVVGHVAGRQQHDQRREPQAQGEPDQPAEQAGREQAKAEAIVMSKRTTETAHARSFRHSPRASASAIATDSRG